MATVAYTAGDVAACAVLAHAALVDVGRRDLADLVCFYVDDDGTPYLEPLDEVTGTDLDLMVRAERIALAAMGGDGLTDPA